ncbi:DNA replication/repair protein RecF [Chthonobacter rhizosphaerae]|uniref:DNA replication/repair protein RecF n=1 Tax=Chthonobacter rhizosphaerae TaxID=2735553 RepID=UPI0015EED6E6|nr:DNA replication/repair protein RecF [Chthonobacter rhizosphaerae]
MDSPARVFVTALRLTDFRNHAAFALAPGRRSVALVGDNGVGKTNCLEAISFLSPGRGLRRAAMAQVARIGGPGGWSVSADVEGLYGAVRLGTGNLPDEPSRLARVDGEPVRSAEAFTDHLRVLWLTPAMDGLFTGPAADRRRFLDRMVLALDPGHGRRVAGLEQALTNRNRLLEDHRSDPAWLDAVEAQIAEAGVAVAAARREAVGCLERLVAAGPAADLFPTARVSLEGDLEAALDTGSASDVEDWYRADLAAGRSRDRAAGRTLVGAHRADFVVHHAVKDMPAALSSTGEQKALLIGLVLAQARLVAELARQTPVLLLDEVVAHLDPGRRGSLFAILSDLGGQVFMTGTDRAPFEPVSEATEIVAVTA